MSLQQRRQNQRRSQPPASSPQPPQQMASHIQWRPVPPQPPPQQPQQMASHIQWRPVPPQPPPQQQRVPPQSNTSQQRQQIRQRLQAVSDSLLRQQQQPQREATPAASASSSSIGNVIDNGGGDGDWREEVYRKIGFMKATYSTELNLMLEKVKANLQKYESLHPQQQQQQSRNGIVEKLRQLKHMLENIDRFLSINKSEIEKKHKDYLLEVEKQILRMFNRRNPSSSSAISLQPGKSPQPDQMPALIQHHSPSQVYQLPPQENRIIPRMMQPKNLQNPMMTTLQPRPVVSSVSPVSSSKQNMFSGVQLQPAAASSLEKGHLQINEMNLLRQHWQQQQHQLKQQQQHPSQLSVHQMLTLHGMAGSTGMKVGQQMAVKPAVSRQHHPNSQTPPYHHPQLKESGNPVSPPQVLQAKYPQVPPHTSLLIDKQNMMISTAKATTPLQAAKSPLVVAPSPVPGESEKSNSGTSQVATVSATGQAIATSAPGTSASSPSMSECTSLDGTRVKQSTVVSSQLSVVEQPIERLIRAVRSTSQKALAASVADINSVFSMVDKIAESPLGNGSVAAVGEDQVAMTKCRLRARNFSTQDGPAGTKRMRRCTSAMSSEAISSVSSENDSMKKLNCSDSLELESTAASGIKRRRLGDHALIEEIQGVNKQLVETLVEISGDDDAAEVGEGIIVKVSYSSVALSPNLKSQYASAKMSPIWPLRLLIPASYPNSSPVILDKFSAAGGKKCEYPFTKALLKFSTSLRTVSQPMSLSVMARTWDFCARAVISEFVLQSSGGTFSSNYGTWESCLTAA
ncbi:OLC1v1025191C1 [Oldenlandia corymbosa var. corymbosa]|uniref:OLC1v1025191C1 n=1 Tax=Oldenlandia corymbosa var. corymbosa TaxID=529605 RepID=A0AAV1C4U4_OLDCO|nr:OLC1v1025191C1 [Oldenlandia corymbosa var. corymbosa]